MENAIFYFSGTGNSLKVCKDLSIELKNLQIIPISTVIKEDIKYPIEKLGIVFPVYFAALPPLVADFIRKLNTSKINYIYAIATCNDFSGAALHIVKKILKKKGKSLNLGFSIIMPGNYLPMYPPLPKDKQEERFKLEIQKVKTISKLIDYNQNNEISFLSRILSFMQKRNDKKLHEKDKNFWVDENCNSCGICEKVCPVENIEIMEGKPQWQHRCQQCLACIHWCPQKSIQYSNKTVEKERYHHPDISLKEMLERIRK